MALDDQKHMHWLQAYWKHFFLKKEREKTDWSFPVGATLGFQKPEEIREAKILSLFNFE
jgi:hypothetical protein